MFLRAGCGNTHIPPHELPRDQILSNAYRKKHTVFCCPAPPARHCTIHRLWNCTISSPATEVLLCHHPTLVLYRSSSCCLRRVGWSLLLWHRATPEDNPRADPEDTVWCRVFQQTSSRSRSLWHHKGEKTTPENETGVRTDSSTVLGGHMWNQPRRQNWQSLLVSVCLSSSSTL